jgi:hypothetical protein
MTDRSFGFIITRHVNSEKTNEYWNKCVQCIQHFYPNKLIVIIDDNSNKDLVKPHHEYQNVIVHHSDFPGRGELLPYIYFIQNDYFDNAVIIHDSVFFHKRLNFESFNGIKVLPFWHFDADKENFINTIRLASRLRNNFDIIPKLSLSETKVLGLRKNKWYGCFGVQCYINRNFLLYLNSKYNITNLLGVVTNRKDRCSLERIFGILFSEEARKNKKFVSVFGKITEYQNFGYSFENYVRDVNTKKPLKPVVKVWTGR